MLNSRKDLSRGIGTLHRPPVLKKAHEILQSNKCRTLNRIQLSAFFQLNVPQDLMGLARQSAPSILSIDAQA
jgi:hypothetical protein